MTLFDLPDDRRAGKPGLPADDRDVTNGLVVPDPNWGWKGRPNCKRHGAMNRVDPVEQIYRCQMCGVGARWEPPEHTKLLPTPMEAEEVEAGRHDDLHDGSRWGRWARNQEIEKFLEIWEVTDDDPAYVGSEEYGERFIAHFDITVKAHWSEFFTYPDGVLEAKDSFEADPIGHLVDAYLEPRYDDDVTEVVAQEVRVEFIGESEGDVLD